MAWALGSTALSYMDLISGTTLGPPLETMGLVLNKPNPTGKHMGSSMAISPKSSLLSRSPTSLPEASPKGLGFQRHTTKEAAAAPQEGGPSH